MIGGFLALGRIALGDAFVVGGLGAPLEGGSPAAAPTGGPFRLRIVTSPRRALRLVTSPRRRLLVKR